MPYKSLSHVLALIKNVCLVAKDTRFYLKISGAFEKSWLSLVSVVRVFQIVHTDNNQKQYFRHDGLMDELILTFSLRFKTGNIFCPSSFSCWPTGVPTMIADGCEEAHPSSTEL